MIEVRIDGLLLDSSNNSPVVLLKELDGDRILPIYIGPSEASNIAYALQQTSFPRPMTLDLMRLLVEGLGGRIRRVIITRIEQDTYFAEVILEQRSRVLAIDARPSDSIGLAVRAGVPLFVAEPVMAKAAQVVSAADEEKLGELRARLRSIDPEELGTYRVGQ